MSDEDSAALGDVKTGRFAIEDSVFVEVRALIGSFVYLWQTSPDSGIETQITLARDGALALGRELVASLSSPASDIAPVDTDDRMVAVASRNLKTFIKAAQFKCNADRDAALACVEVLDDRISAAQGRDRWAGVIERVEQITAEEGASVTFVCANRDFNGLPNEAVTVMQGEDWQEVTYRGDTLAACLQQAIEQKGAGQ